MSQPSQIWWPLVEYAALVFVSKALKVPGFFERRKNQGPREVHASDSYCWWFRNPAFTSWYGKNIPLFSWFYNVLYIPGGAGFLPSTVCKTWGHLLFSTRQEAQSLVYIKVQQAARPGKIDWHLIWTWLNGLVLNWGILKLQITPLHIFMGFL